MEPEYVQVKKGEAVELGYLYVWQDRLIQIPDDSGMIGEMWRDDFPVMYRKFSEQVEPCQQSTVDDLQGKIAANLQYLEVCPFKDFTEKNYESIKKNLRKALMSSGYYTHLTEGD